METDLFCFKTNLIINIDLSMILFQHDSDCSREYIALSTSKNHMQNGIGLECIKMAHNKTKLDCTELTPPQSACRLLDEIYLLDHINMVTAPASGTVRNTVTSLTYPETGRTFV